MRKNRQQKQQTMLNVVLSRETHGTFMRCVKRNRTQASRILRACIDDYIATHAPALAGKSSA